MQNFITKIKYRWWKQRKQLHIIIKKFGINKHSFYICIEKIGKLAWKQPSFKECAESAR